MTKHVVNADQGGIPRHRQALRELETTAERADHSGAARTTKEVRRVQWTDSIPNAQVTNQLRQVGLVKVVGGSRDDATGKSGGEGRLCVVNDGRSRISAFPQQCHARVIARRLDR